MVAGGETTVGGLGRLLHIAALSPKRPNPSDVAPRLPSEVVEDARDDAADEGERGDEPAPDDSPLAVARLRSESSTSTDIFADQEYARAYFSRLLLGNLGSMADAEPQDVTIKNMSSLSEEAKVIREAEAAIGGADAGKMEAAVDGDVLLDDKGENEPGESAGASQDPPVKRLATPQLATAETAERMADDEETIELDDLGLIIGDVPHREEGNEHDAPILEKSLSYVSQIGQEVELAAAPPKEPRKARRVTAKATKKGRKKPPRILEPGDAATGIDGESSPERTPRTPRKLAVHISSGGRKKHAFGAEPTFPDDATRCSKASKGSRGSRSSASHTSASTRMATNTRRHATPTSSTKKDGATGHAKLVTFSTAALAAASPKSKAKTAKSRVKRLGSLLSPRKAKSDGNVGFSEGDGKAGSTTGHASMEGGDLLTDYIARRTMKPFAPAAVPAAVAAQGGSSLQTSSAAETSGGRSADVDTAAAMKGLRPDEAGTDEEFPEGAFPLSRETTASLQTNTTAGGTDDGGSYDSYDTSAYSAMTSGSLALAQDTDVTGSFEEGHPLLNYLATAGDNAIEAVAAAGEQALRREVNALICSMGGPEPDPNDQRNLLERTADGTLALVACEPCVCEEDTMGGRSNGDSEGVVSKGTDAASIASLVQEDALGDDFMAGILAEIQDEGVANPSRSESLDGLPHDLSDMIAGAIAEEEATLCGKDSD
ncbi:hypothetical protein ACHAXT_000869 [Thalassiosira profunda]